MSKQSSSSPRPTRRLYQELLLDPYPYTSPFEKRERMEHVLRTCGNLIPRLHLAFMFGYTPETISGRIKTLFPEMTRLDKVQLFHLWLKKDVAEGLEKLKYPERVYLRGVSREVAAAYRKQRSWDLDDYAENLLKKLKAADKKHGDAAERVACSEKHCPNIFPAGPEFFPNLRYGKKRPGRCAVCSYYSKAKAGRRYRRQGRTRPPGVVLNETQRQRFRQIEDELRFELPTRVLAELFGITSSTVNNLRTKPLERKEGKAVFHRFQMRQEAPSFDMLTDEENHIVAKQWRKIRGELSRSEFDSKLERIRELVKYTSLRRSEARVELRTCESCLYELAADEFCFPYGRKRRTREKVLRRHCRACYSTE